MSTYLRILFIFCLGGAQELPGLHGVGVLLRSRLEEEHGAGQISLLRRKLSTISVRLDFLKCVKIYLSSNANLYRKCV